MNAISRAYHYLFGGMPKFMRYICRITMGLFLFFGICLMMRELVLNGANPGRIFGYLAVFAVSGVICTCFTGLLWQLLVKGSKRNLNTRLTEALEHQGYSREMAETIKNANMFPSDKEKLQQTFVTVQSELYGEAEAMLTQFNVSALSTREAAAYYTCRLQIYVMTGAYEKQQKLFAEQQAFLDRAYEMKTDLMDTYTPYADDALCYYMLAAALSAHQRHPEQTAAYEKKANFQVSQRSEPETQLFPHILKLNRLYAEGKMQAAHEIETNLRAAILQSVMPPGTQRNLLRWTEQARVYSTLPIDKSDFLAERNLPVQNPQALPAAPAQTPTDSIPDLDMPTLF